MSGVDELYKRFRDLSSGAKDVSLNEDALTAACVAVEDALIEFRDSRISELHRANGFVVREVDGSPSDVIRLGTRNGLAIALRAYLAALGAVASGEGATP